MAGRGRAGPTFNALAAKNGDLRGAPDIGRGPGKTSGAPQIPAGPRCGAPGGACQVIPPPVPRPGPRTLRGGAGRKFHAPAPCAVRGGERILRPAPPRSEHYPDDWRKLDPELIASKCFLFPKPSSSNGWTTTRGQFFGHQGDHGARMGPVAYHCTSAINNPPNTAHASPGTHSDARITRAGHWQPSSSCRNWNYGEGHVQQCQYLHTCISCGANHQASQCTGSGASGGATSR